MTVDRRRVISGLATFAAVFGISSLAIARPARALVAGAVKLDCPFNPRHVRAMFYVRKMARKLLMTGEVEFEEISATCRYLRGETGTYNPWHTTLYLFDIMYRAIEHLGAMGLNKDEINAVLGRLDTEMEIKRLRAIRKLVTQSL